MAIKASVNKHAVSEAAREKGMHAILTDLRLDGTKSHRLLTSELGVEKFVLDVFKSNLRPAGKPRPVSSSSNNNGEDDITEVCNSRNPQQSPPPLVTTFTQPQAEVEKTPSNSVNCSSLSSSTLQPRLAIDKAPKSQLHLSLGWQDSLEINGINTPGSGETQITHCKRRESESVQQQNYGENSQQLKASEAQNVERSAQEVAQPGRFPTDARSVSSNEPPPKESLFKRLRDQFISSQ